MHRQGVCRDVLAVCLICNAFLLVQFLSTLELQHVNLASLLVTHALVRLPLNAFLV